MSDVKKNLLGIFFNLEEDEKTVTPEKPLKEQIGESTRPFNVLGVTPPAPSAVPTPTVTVADKEKYEKYFGDLYESTNCPKPSYHEFIAIAEAFSMLPATQRFPAALNSFKGALTKDVVLQTAQQTLESVKNDAVSYNAALQEKLDTQVGTKRQQLEQKKQELLKLQQEIQSLEVDIQQSEAELHQKAAGYNAYSSQLQSKIQNDINEISSSL